ncbi:MAG: hypothetical protein LR011_04055 [Verrucomicrobia bacterium]|nr:hypothetical protein [Verrucomicrobiota bacterium]
MWIDSGCGPMDVDAGAQSQLVLIEQFNPAEVGSIVGLAFDNATDQIWVYGEFLGMIHSYSRAGEFIGSIERPGEAANDVDLDVAGGPLTLGEVAIPSGTLLMINGETDVAEIFALDPSTGQVLATRATSFGDEPCGRWSIPCKAPDIFSGPGQAAGWFGER